MVELTTADLRAAGLEECFEAIDDAVADHLEGDISNVAVIGEPFAGREVLVEYADDAFGAASDSVTYDSVVTDPADLEVPNTEVVLVDGCHNLYTRQIGGYDVLDAFLAEVADSDAMFVTAWNRYAWDYLSAVRDVEHAFPVQIRIPPLDAGAIADLIESHYGPTLPEFVQTSEGGRVKSVTFQRKDVSPVGERSVGVPVPELNLEYITSRRAREVDDVEAVVFQKLAYLSEGNPGVACHIWERCVRDGEIAPSYVEEVEGTLDIDDDEAFLLELILAKDEMRLDTLSDILVNVPVERALGSLVGQNVLETEGENVRPIPERLNAIVEHLRGRQLIW